MSEAHFVVRYNNSREIVIVCDNGVTQARAKHVNCEECANVVLDMEAGDYEELLTETGWYTSVETGRHGFEVAC